LKSRHKIRYQAMLDADNYEAITALNREAKHRSLSETLNQIVRNYFRLTAEIYGNKKEKQKKKPKNALDSIEKKFGIEEYTKDYKQG